MEYDDWLDLGYKDFDDPTKVLTCARCGKMDHDEVLYTKVRRTGNYVPLCDNCCNLHEDRYR